MTHGHCPKWLQTTLASLKKYPGGVESDIFIAESWPGHPSSRAAKETPLGDGVTFLDCERRLHSHATGLERCLEHVWDMGYDYFFASETDCVATAPDWLSWYLGYLEDDPRKGIAGLFWDEQPCHFNMNPSATLYRMDMLKQYHEESRANESQTFFHPNGNKNGHDEGMDPTIATVGKGVFAETRGIENPSPVQLDAIARSVPAAAHWEPGHWLSIRSMDEWKHVHVPNDHIYAQVDFGTAPDGTFYNGKDDPKFIHYWGGTRSYDFLKHPVNDGFVRGGSPWWIKREDRIWREWVNEEDRQIVHELTKEANTEEKMRENLGIFVPEVM